MLRPGREIAYRSSFIFFLQLQMQSHLFFRRIAPAAMAAACALALLPLAGCGGSESPQFRLNLQGRNPADFVATGGDSEAEEKAKQARAEGLQYVADSLYAMFGTPDDPFVFQESGLNLAKIRLAAGPSGGDETGRQRGLYRQHCAHCHGISGDGAGPTAAFLTPYPRDYRQGKFKFKSTERTSKPTNEDLKRVLIDGIPGTAMPSFALLPNDELESLVEYVKYLSIRGEVESTLMLLLFDFEEELDRDRSVLVDQALAPVAATWQQAAQEIIEVPERPPIETSEQLAMSIALGERLFRGGRAQCMKCHGPTALGDGSEEALFDDWNKDKTEEAFLWLLPKQQTNPRNLRLGIYRGGRNPDDLYRRIHAGINGTPMPATGPSPGAPAVLQPEEIWNLVDYVRSLPFGELSETQSSSQQHDPHREHL